MNKLAYLIRLAYWHSLDFALGYPKEHTVMGNPAVVRIRHTGGVWGAVRISTYCKRRASWVKTDWRHGWRFVEVPGGYGQYLNRDNLTEDIGTAVYNMLEGQRMLDQYLGGRMEG